jgi:hypothetical protein
VIIDNGCVLKKQIGVFAISGQWQDLLSAEQPTVAFMDIRENGWFSSLQLAAF